MSTDRKLSMFSHLLLASTFVGLAIFVPTSLKHSQVSDRLVATTPYEPLAVPTASDRLYDYHESETRPLFVENRRAVLQKPTPSSDTDQSTDPYAIKMEAVIGGPDGLSAGLRVSSQASLTWVREGQRIQKWKVAAIREDAVRLQHGDETVELRLYPKRQRIAGE